MSRTHAPLYVVAHDLCRWLHGRQAPGDALRRARELALTLVGEVALALTFPKRRPDHLIAADETVVRLRCTLRVARDAGDLPANATRYAIAELDRIGRMLGGWQRSLLVPTGKRGRSEDQV
ncbi:MAG: hypothetical protein KDC87_14690 [Planctomycetes bacterium]|nr:hypothetical protein [Planctomycetota bacterium]